MSPREGEASRSAQSVAATLEAQYKTGEIVWLFMSGREETSSLGSERRTGRAETSPLGPGNAKCRVMRATGRVPLVQEALSGCQALLAVRFLRS